MTIPRVDSLFIRDSVMPYISSCAFPIDGPPAFKILAEILRPGRVTELVPLSEKDP